jgi:hypothetical protein
MAGGQALIDLGRPITRVGDTPRCNRTVPAKEALAGEAAIAF